jgi:hypothetical protein
MISKIYSKVKTFLSVMMSTLIYQNVTLINLSHITVVCDDTDNGWILFDPKNPPEHKVVLAACDSYDCGWCMSMFGGMLRSNVGCREVV